MYPPLCKRDFYCSPGKWRLKIVRVLKITHGEIFVADTVKPNPRFGRLPPIVQRLKACDASPPIVFISVSRRIKFGRLQTKNQLKPLNMGFGLVCNISNFFKPLLLSHFTCWPSLSQRCVALFVFVGKTPTRWTPGPWGCWWKWRSCTGSISVASSSSALTVSCTSFWATAWSLWTTWRRWTGSGETRRRMFSLSQFHTLVSFLPLWSCSCPCAWMQWFHRVRPPGRRGHGLLHVPLFHTAEQPVLQQHQPASWNLCPRFTRPRQVSVSLAVYLCATVWEPCEVTTRLNPTSSPLCRCAVDRLRSDNGSFLILCTDASGKNASAGRILEITKGKDYGE